jgi:hypothetical protein
VAQAIGGTGNMAEVSLIGSSLRDESSDKLMARLDSNSPLRCKLVLPCGKSS